MSIEKKVEKEIMLELSRWGCTCFRNATATAWVGDVIYRNAREVSMKNAQPIQAGLCVGSPDIVGYASDGRFVGIEVKRTKGGRVSEEQKRFMAIAKANNCIVGVARSVEELQEILSSYGLTRMQ